VLTAALCYDSATPFPGAWALLPVLGAVLVLAGGCVPARYGAGQLLGRRLLVRLGGLSYGLYLWHWPLLVVVPVALGRPAGTAGPLLGLALCAAALVLAWLTLRYVENPVRFHRAFTGRPRRALALGVALSAVAGTLSLAAAAVPPTIETGGPAPALARTLDLAEDPEAELTALITSAPAQLPSNLTPSLPGVRSARSAVYRDGCHVDYDSITSPPCVYGDATASKTMVLFGDSHAAQWFPALDRIAARDGWRLVSLTKASCKAAEVTIVHSHGPYTDCDTWRAKAEARIKALRPALIVVSSSEAGDPVSPADDLRRQWRTGYAATFRGLAASGAEVAALLDNPWPKGDPIGCAADNSLQLPLCAQHLPDAYEDPDRRAAVREAAADTGAHVIDPAPWICDTRSGDCPVVVGDTAVYRDESHLADAYAAGLAPVLASALPTAVRGPDTRTAPGTE
jgi:hypothetical protein